MLLGQGDTHGMRPVTWYSDMGYWGTPITIERVPTNPVDNNASTRETISRMVAIAKVCSNSPIVVNLVASLIRSLPAKSSKMDLARAIFYWIKNHVTFTEDEGVVSGQLGYQDFNQELLIAPIVLLEMPQPAGDCDDFSMLAASLCLAARIPVWYVAIAVDEAEPNRWSHVFCQVLLDGHKVSFDASHGRCLGWHTSRQIYRRAEWFVG